MSVVCCWCGLSWIPCFSPFMSVLLVLSWILSFLSVLGVWLAWVVLDSEFRILHHVSVAGDILDTQFLVHTECLAGAGGPGFRASTPSCLCREGSPG